MILLIKILILFGFGNQQSNYSTSKTELLSGTTQKSWSLNSMIPDKRCPSASDDTWTFFFDGTFEFSRGAITEDEASKCSDFVNIVGKWEFKDNESVLKVVGLYEKENPDNTFSITFMEGKIEMLDEETLVVIATETATGVQHRFEFKEK